MFYLFHRFIYDYLFHRFIYDWSRLEFVEKWIDLNVFLAILEEKDLSNCFGFYSSNFARLVKILSSGKLKEILKKDSSQSKVPIIQLMQKYWYKNYSFSSQFLHKSNICLYENQLIFHENHIVESWKFQRDEFNFRMEIACKTSQYSNTSEPWGKPLQDLHDILSLSML